MSDDTLHTALRDLSAHSTDGIICLDATGRPLWWNPSATRFFFSVTADATSIARRLDDLLCVTEPEQLQHLLKLRHGKLTTNLETLDGGLPVRLSITSLESSSVPPVPLKLIIVEPLIMTSERWPADTFRLFATLLHRIKNTFAAVKLLAQGAQLELTMTDLSGISLINMVETCFQRIDTEVDRAVDALDTVKHLLAATGTSTRAISLGQHVRSTVEERSRDMVSAGVTVDVSERGSAGEAFVDPDAVRQIVHNLMDRVRRVATNSGRHHHLEIFVEQRGAQVALVFHDDGPAIPPETVGRLARREFTSSQEELPLMVVHWIVDRYQGRIVYSSPEEIGCTVEVILPRTPLSVSHQER